MDSGHIDDLLLKSQWGSEVAINELLQIHHRYMLGVAFKILKDRDKAEDAVQRAMVTIYNKVGSFRCQSKFSTWVARIVINECMATMRSDHRWIKGYDNSDAVLASYPPDPIGHIFSLELRGFIKRTLSLIDKKHREAILLFYVQDRTLTEAAKTVKCPIGTMKSRVFYGRRMFRGIFEKLICQNQIGKRNE